MTWNNARDSRPPLNQLLFLVDERGEIFVDQVFGLEDDEYEGSCWTLKSGEFVETLYWMEIPPIPMNKGLITNDLCIEGLLK